MIPERPTPLTLGYGGLLITIAVHDGDPHLIVVDTKALNDISRAIVRTYVKAKWHPVAIKSDLPAAPRLWIGQTAVELATDDHITRATAWVESYNAWLVAGELRGAA